MTFNSNAKPNRSGAQSTSFADSEALKLINEIEVNYVDYERNYDILKIYNKSISGMPDKEYIKSGQENRSVAEKIKKQVISMIKCTERLSELDIIDSNLKSRSLECLRTVTNKVRPRQVDLEQLLNDIIKKERSKNESISIALEDNSKGPNLDKRGSTQSNGSYQNQVNLRESLIEVKDIEFNQLLMNQREKELFEIQKASAQVKDLTKLMGVQVEEQGQLVNNIGEMIDETKENVVKADEQIVAADKDVSSSGRKLCIIALLIVVVVAIVVVIVVLSVLKP